MGSEGRQVLAEVVEQIRLRRMGFERLIVAIQLVAIVIHESRSPRLAELEDPADGPALYSHLPLSTLRRCE